MNSSEQPKKKKKSMQDEADRLFALQMEHAGTTKGADRIIILLFCLMLAAFGVLIYILPANEFSEEENRTLQTFPKIQSNYDGTLLERIEAGKFLDRYFSGKFADDIGTFYADQFPARNFFVGLKAGVEIALGKGENNDVLLGKDGTLITAMDNVSCDKAVSNLTAAKEFTDELAEYGIPVTTAIAGRTIDIETDKLPALYSTAEAEKPWTAVLETADSLNFDFLNLKDVLCEKEAEGEDVMYATDHHWTSLGAYEAYCAILESWGMEPLSRDAFTIEVASDSFYGTAWRTAGMKWVEPDTIEYWHFDGDDDFTTTIMDTGVSFSGFYDRSYLEVTDKYSSFISGNNAYVTITKNSGEPREKLLLVKDSFGHSLAPFLAAHFDLVIVDLRYYKQSTAALAQETGCSRALILYNMASLTDGTTLSLLKLH